MRRKTGRPLNGWLIVDKPPGMTSTDVVNRVRRGFDAQKAGHGGTLDPLATGVLPVAFGSATKTVPYVQDGTKLYRFTLRLGDARDTDDADGQTVATYFDANESVGLQKPALSLYLDGGQTDPPLVNDVYFRDGRLWTVRKTQLFRLGDTPLLILALCD